VLVGVGNARLLVAVSVGLPVLVEEAAALDLVAVSVGLPVLVGKARLRVAVPVPVLVEEIPRDLVIVPELVEVNV